MPSGSSAEELKAERRDELMDRRRELQGRRVTAAAATAAGGAGADMATTAAQMARREVEMRLVKMELNMIDGFDTLDRDHKGYDTTLSLMAVDPVALGQSRPQDDRASSPRGCPCRRCSRARLDDVVDAANRAQRHRVRR